ncbi:FAD-dependent oxidoreductase [Planomonospora sp. ID67723]|uniref:flavin monoamine oxidase family protein n=1 Tax=Planomonospora sp. ID67723 TaxID=2738134 RepID=UPI0018C35323|nr:FAD-dependent oxidoreductase [Planomonospora sp. ID67723]MBG0831532.1 FAD-dependent oxidoreductase [Planomonospora sp. ID67723]
MQEHTVTADRLPAVQSGEVDAVVVGAGLAGLLAARRLHQAGMNVVVCEAKDRVGGRMLTMTSTTGVPVDAGAAWVGPGQKAVLALLEELGIGLIPQYDDGANLLHVDGRTYRYQGSIPPVGPIGLLDLGRAQYALDRMAHRLGPPPWHGAYARRLDAQTLGGWMRRHVHTHAGRMVFEAVTASGFGCRPDALSLLAFSAHVGGAGGLSSLLEVSGALKYRIAGGADSLTTRLAADLGGRVLTGHPITHISRTDRTACVNGPGSTSITARHVLIATDPATARAIAHDPPLPTARADLQRRWQMGHGSKTHLIYSRPWWRDRGLTGAAITECGLARMTFDVSPPDPDAPGVLLAFVDLSNVDDPNLLRPGAAPERERQVLDDLEALFGEQVRDRLDYLEHDWAAEPWQSGCVPAPPPGLLASHHPWLARPIGPLHWAGAETSYLWEGHMDGAVRSANRAVTEILTVASSERLKGSTR